jgi:hypothetical protein
VTNPLIPFFKGDVTAELPVLGEVTFECKSRKDFKTLYGWLGPHDGLVLKADRRDTLVLLKLDDFIRLVSDGR